MRRETASRKTSTAVLPAKAARICHRGLTTSERPNSEAQNVIRATASEAPELIPRMEGSASGLRNKVCIIRPHTPSAPPATRAVMASGKRFSRTITSVIEPSPPPSRTSSTSRRGMATVPVAMFKASSTAMAPNSPVATSTYPGCLAAERGKGQFSGRVFIGVRCAGSNRDDSLSRAAGR